MSLGEECWMPIPHPPEFRRRAVELARRREQPIAQVARIWGSASRVCGTGWPAPTSTTAAVRG